MPNGHIEEKLTVNGFGLETNLDLRDQDNLRTKLNCRVSHKH